MNYIVAVSGGVDSVVLLDMLSRAEGKRLVVAHVDHGIRAESTAEARFVHGLARQYQLPYVQVRLELGKTASEDAARQARYEFLFAKAREHKAIILTAHHQDDLIGSLAINQLRGTGWRGLAVMNRPGISRPLLGWSKARIYKYALDHRLEWVEDASNHSSLYLRNRLRAAVLSLPSKTHQGLVELRLRQLQLVRDIDHETGRVSRIFDDRRYPYTMVPPKVAIELLRRQWPMTRLAAERLLAGIKTARPRTSQQLPDGYRVEFTAQTFTVTSRSSDEKMIK